MVHCELVNVHCEIEAYCQYYLAVFAVICYNCSPAVLCHQAYRAKKLNPWLYEACYHIPYEQCASAPLFSARKA